VTRLVLLRHGESLWNRENRFTGWTDVPLTPKGEVEARRAGELLARAGFGFDLCFTSVLRRGVESLRLVLEGMGEPLLPTIGSWYLNERHFGALQGMGRLEAVRRFGPWRVFACQRRYEVQPPPLDREDVRHPATEPSYAPLGDDQVPATESLRDTVERLRPYWDATLVPEIRKGHRLLVVAHKNSLRAMVRLLGGASDREVPRLAIRTGRPLVLELDDSLAPVRRYYLDPGHDPRSHQEVPTATRSARSSTP
jgi:2,3-bisphosphoglycerate-dependent phosphoglycerate mutase